MTSNNVHTHTIVGRYEKKMVQVRIKRRDGECLVKNKSSNSRGIDISETISFYTFVCSRNLYALKVTRNRYDFFLLYARRNCTVLKRKCSWSARTFRNTRGLFVRGRQSHSEEFVREIYSRSAFGFRVIVVRMPARDERRGRGGQRPRTFGTIKK